jgi:hypothetical protein
VSVEPSPKRADEAVRAIADFKAACVAHLTPATETIRQAVHPTMPAAQRAINLVDANIAVNSHPAKPA